MRQMMTRSRTVHSWEAAWDRPFIDIAVLVQAQAWSSAELMSTQRLVSLMRFLPRGLVHAENVTIVRSAPQGFQQLADGSAWWAKERCLSVVCSHHELDRWLETLGAYCALGKLLGRRLRFQKRLVESLLDEELKPPDRLGLCSLLELEPNGLERIESYKWLSEVGWLARKGFSATVAVEPALRPTVRKQYGERLGAELAEGLSGPVPVFCSQDPLCLNLVSPYVRDLGHALYAWGIENAEKLNVPFLLEALQDTANAPDPDLASLVAEIVEELPDIRDERRWAEESQGLTLRDVQGMTAGFAELSQLAAPDACLANASGGLAFLFGPDPYALESALDVLLEAGRVQMLGLVGAVDAVGSRPYLPRALTTRFDGYALPGVERLLQRVQQLNFEVHEVEVVEMGVFPTVGWLPSTLGRVRRQMVRDKSFGSMDVFVALYPAESPQTASQLAQRRAALDAGRITLSEIAHIRTRKSSVPTVGVSPAKDRPLGRRFRG